MASPREGGLRGLIQVSGPWLLGLCEARGRGGQTVPREGERERQSCCYVKASICMLCKIREPGIVWISCLICCIHQTLDTFRGNSLCVCVCFGEGGR
jgi:hypothetical protein